MTTPTSIDELRSSVEDARRKTAAARIFFAEARAIADTATKSDKVAAARTAAEAKQAATDAAAEQRRLETLLDRAERAAEKAADAEAKAAQKATEKKAADRIAAEAAAAKAALSEASAAQDAEEPPVEIDWARLADEFVPIARETIAFVDGSWAGFDDSRWDLSAHRGLALARKAAVEFFRYRPGDEGVQLRKIGTAPETLLRYAQLELTRSGSDFNDRARTAHLFNVANGTLDLRTGKLRKAWAADLLTFKSDVRLNSKADVARIRDGFVKNLAGDMEQLDCLQRTMGYAITGERREKKAFFLLGNEKKRGENGDNGKTLFMESVRRVVGNAAGGIKPSLIVASSNKRGANEHDGALVPLARVRLAIGAEFGRNDVMDEDTFKRITGGDTIQARGVGAADSINFVCVAKPIFTTNYLVLVPSRDAAMIGRILAFPFFVRFRRAGEPGDGPVADQAFSDWLETNEGQEAMLLWIVKGALEWYRQGINPPASLIALRDAHMAQHDTWAPFVSAYLVEDPAGEISVSALKALAEVFRGGAFRNQSEEGAFLRDLDSRGSSETFHRGGKAYRRGYALSDLAERTLNTGGFGKLVPGRVIQMDTFEIREPFKPAAQRVRLGDLPEDFARFFESQEEALVPGGDWLTVPGKGQMRRIR